MKIAYFKMQTNTLKTKPPELQNSKVGQKEFCTPPNRAWPATEVTDQHEEAWGTQGTLLVSSYSLILLG